MSMRCIKVSWLFSLVMLLTLVACVGQPVKQEEQSAESADAMADASAEKTMPVVEVNPEPPAVEVTPVEVSPRKQMNESPIALEAISVKPPVKEVLLADVLPVNNVSPVNKESLEADQVVAEQKPQLIEKEAARTDSVVPGTAPVENESSQQMAVIKSDLAAEGDSVAMEKKQPVVMGQPAAMIVPVSTDPNNFVVTVAAKQVGHPAYGKGHPMGFLVNGVSGQELVVQRGQIYTFDIATDPKHDVYLSKKAIGWGGAPYSAGVEGAYTYKGKMTFKPSKDSPDQLFYACRNHPYMGAIIHVVNPGQTVEIKQRAAQSASAGKTLAPPGVSLSKVKQKIMFAEMMARSLGIKRVMASQNIEAQKLVSGAKELMSKSSKQSQAAALPEALSMANQALKMLGEATRLVPDEEELAQLAENYKALLAEITDYQTSYQNNLKRLKKQGALDESIVLDEKKFAGVMTEAKSYAGRKNYVHANKLLQQAQTTMTVALHKMLDSKTLVYDLNFETPADEYKYEVKRFTGYEELIPIAIEAKKPAAGAVKLMESFLAKARKRRDEAQAKAGVGDYPSAIEMMLQATKTVRRALRMVGVSQ